MRAKGTIEQSHPHPHTYPATKAALGGEHARDGVPREAGDLLREEAHTWEVEGEVHTHGNTCTDEQRNILTHRRT